MVFSTQLHMKNKRLKKARKEEPHWGAVKVYKEKRGEQEIYRRIFADVIVYIFPH